MTEWIENVDAYRQGCEDGSRQPPEAEMADASLDTLAITGWPFAPGQKVRVRDGDDWKADWRGIELRVIGINLDRSGFVRVHVSEDWPKDGGADDMLADDLIAI